MYRTDYESESMPFVIEGEHTRVLGIGQVTGKLLVARTPRDIIYGDQFDEPGVIPLLIDEFAVTEYKRDFNGLTRKLAAGLWSGFVTFGSSEMIRSRRRNNEDPSHFMITLRELVSNGSFIAVIDNDEGNKLSDRTNAAMLRSEVGVLGGFGVVLTAVSETQAKIEFDIKE